MKIETVITVNGIVASTSCTATMDDPCCDHAANFTSEGGEIGDLNDTVYGELSDAWESRDDGDNWSGWRRDYPESCLIHVLQPVRPSPVASLTEGYFYLSSESPYRQDVSNNCGEMNMSMRALAEALVIRCTVGELAELINATLSVEDDERLMDDQVEAADSLHHLLCELKPEAAELAQSL